MNDKYTLIFTLLLVFTVQAKVFSQTDTAGAVINDADGAIRNEAEIGPGWAINTKYKYSVVQFRYYSPGFIRKDRVRLRFDLEGYRITRYLITEYNRLIIQADYKVKLQQKGNYEHYILPKAGFSLIFNLYDGTSPTKGLSFAPNIGVDYEGRTGRFRFHAKSAISFFSDGLWLELNPEVYLRTFKNVYLKAGMNIIVANTFNANSAVGFFPGAGVSIFPNRKKR